MTKPPASSLQPHLTGYGTVVPAFECELVLRENAHESRRPHSLPGEVRPGMIVRFDEEDWVVIETRGEFNRVPEVVCRPVYERL
jgi:hypothetical protein